MSQLMAAASGRSSPSPLTVPSAVTSHRTAQQFALFVESFVNRAQLQMKGLEALAECGLDGSDLFQRHDTPITHLT